MRTRGGSSLGVARHVAVLALVAAVAAASAASAHTTPPSIVTTVESVAPALPDGVHVFVISSVSEELVVANTTATPVEVLSNAGEPFLRISSTLVQANVSSPDWWTSNDPTGALQAPRSAKVGAPARWLTVQHGNQWAWFDHRMHPSAIVIPLAISSGNRDALLSRWSVPMRYGSQQVTVKGRVDYKPVRGNWLVTVEHTPDGVTAQVAQGRLPALFVRTTRPIEIRGSDSGEFATLSEHGTYVNTTSPTWIADQQARGVAPDGHPAEQLKVGDSATLTWLEPRLAPRTDLPTDQVLARSSPTVVSRWSIPTSYLTAGNANPGGDEITGTLSWVPNTQLASSAHHRASPLVVIAVVIVVLLGLLVLLLRLRRVNRSKNSSVPE